MITRDRESSGSGQVQAVKKHVLVRSEVLGMLSVDLRRGFGGARAVRCLWESGIAVVFGIFNLFLYELKTVN